MKSSRQSKLSGPERARKELRGPRDEKGEVSRNKKYEAKLSRAMVRQSLL